MQDFRDVFAQGHADAALAASVFHFGQISIPQLKEYLKEEKRVVETKIEQLKKVYKFFEKPLDK